MFKLEKLEISGFKSFPDRTTLHFGEGITGVVGPNGCGKSNLAEAISWVLGEQSAKNLRGGKMEDVIFNGTRDRKPTGMAEVLLTLVAVADIAAREAEAGEDEETHYDEALETAARAADAARSLVQELTPPAEANQSTEPPSQPDAEAAVTSHDATAAPLAVEGEPAQPADAPAEAAPAEPQPEKKTERKRAPRPRRRQTVAIAAGERVTIGRRLYRTGDSDYLMNGRPCLLRDIQDLFAGTGLGGAHYAIIEQGKIGQILSSKPLDRRALIEEAAGITKFKSRKRATELRLESAKQNLTRLNDIISEVERQVNSLKRQAQKARRYRRLREEMRALLKVVFTADSYRLSEAIERVARELDEAGALQAQLDAQLAERESEGRAVSAEAREAENRLAALRQQAAAIELEADRARNRRTFDEQQIKELSARIDELTRDQQALETRLATLDAEAGRQAESLRALEAEVVAEQAELLRREGEYQGELARLRAEEGDIEQLRQRLLTEIGLTERLKNLRASLEETLRKLDLRQTNLRAEFERATSRRDEAAAEFDRVSGEVEGARRRLAELAEHIAERAERLAALRSQLFELRGERDALQGERAAAEHRLASLEELDAHHAYYSDTVQQVLSPEQAARINAMGTLADFVEVEAQYEKLVESLFGRELQCVLVPTIDDALAGVDFIKAENLGRGGFLVVGLHGGEDDAPAHDAVYANHDAGQGAGEANGSPAQPANDAAQFHETAREPAPAPSAPEAEGAAIWPAAPDAYFQLEALRAIDLLGLRTEIKAVVERAFPDKCAALVVPDMEAALHLSIENPSRIYVTNAGEQVVNGRLIVTGGQAGQKGASLLGLKREIKQLRVQTATLREEERRVAERLDEAQRQLAEIESEATTLDRELRQQEKTAAARDSQMEALARDLERAEQHVRVVEAESQMAADERVELEARQTQLAAELEQAEASRAEVQESLSRAQAALVELRARVDQFSEALSSARASVAARAERLQAARGEARRLQNEAEELRGRINRNRLELYESHGRIEQLTASQSEVESAAARYEGERARLAERIAEASEHLAARRARADELETLLADLRQQSSAAHDRRGHLEVERARLESDAEHLARQCFAELAMPLEDVVTSVELARAAEAQLSAPGAPAGEGAAEVAAQADEEEGQPEPQAGGSPLTSDIEAARARLGELRVKLDDMGPVNMMALEELEEAEERFKFLSEQRRDILDSIKDTEEALAEIKRRSRERFRHAFTHINQNFQQMFVELFGGGRGEMILLDEDDVLESGIDLIAQPPGKRLQNVLLLSGGEKAMAAISLVLAIFQYRPSPFCILDEVDAPLDEMNVGRFANKVAEMSRETQFLVITHNKRTMEAARALYGVTMEEPGISKLVSVKFE